MSERRDLFKKGARGVNEVRKNRNTVTVELRKNKREETLNKRRNVPEADLDISLEENDPKTGSSPPSLPEILIQVRSNDVEVQFEGVRSARRLLSREKNPPIDEFIASGILPVLIDCLKKHHHEKLQFEAAWALTNLASGNSQQTQAVVMAGAVPVFVALLSSRAEAVCEQAVWALGNIIGDGPDMRDICINEGVVDPLLRLISPNMTLSFMRNVTWVIVNLCRNKDPLPSMDTIAKLLPALCFLLTKDDTLILIDAVWAISYLSDGGHELIQMVIESGAIGKLVPLLSHPEDKIQTATLRAVGNVVTGNDEQTQVVLDCGALSHIHVLLGSPKDKIVKEAAWFLSNITAGNQQQIQAVIDAGLIPGLIHCLSKGDFMTQREAVWAVTNLSISGSGPQVEVLLQNGVIEPLCRILTLDDPSVIQVALDGINNIFKSNEAHVNLIAEEIEKCGGLDDIEKLQSHENDGVYTLAYDIIDNYFSEDGEEDANVAPAVSSTGFQFQGPTNLPNTGFNF